jgi:hypothetical protein
MKEDEEELGRKAPRRSILALGCFQSILWVEAHLKLENVWQLKDLQARFSDVWQAKDLAARFS